MDSLNGKILAIFGAKRPLANRSWTCFFASEARSPSSRDLGNPGREIILRAQDHMVRAELQELRSAG